MGYHILVCLTLAFTLAGCARMPASGETTTPVPPTARPTPDLTSLDDDQAKQLITQSINNVSGVSVAGIVRIEGARYMIVYTTKLTPKAQTEAFTTQFRQIVYAAVPGYVRSEWTSLVLLPRSPDGIVPGMAEIKNGPAQKWYTGKIDDVAFERTWIVAW